MYRIKTFNKISKKGLARFERGSFQVSPDFEQYDAIILRSFKLHDMEFDGNLRCIARAGAGVNNIPVDKCSEKGIVVFNTPGANANAVKELVIASLFLSSRKISDAIGWAKTIKGKGELVPKLVEKEKSKFAGPEIMGKTLGVIGLGAIGVMVANAAVGLGMNVLGHDPYISIQNAWGLSRNVNKSDDINEILSCSDYITIHVPLLEETRGMISDEQFDITKKGARLINLSRGGIVDNKALLKAIDKKIIKTYVTDFPEDEILCNDNIIAIPHLGASTLEAEDNCAVMAADQSMEYLNNGNILNSVNYPECMMQRSSKYRLTVAHRNIPNMVGQISTILANSSINILNMVNKSKKNYAYTIIDIEEKIPEETLKKILAVDGVLKTRVI